MSETDELKRMQLAVARIATLFRQNVGLCWIGKAVRYTKPTTVRVGNGDVVIRQARPLHAGLVVGSSDLIGWLPVVIRPEHVGKTFAIFTAVEGKSDDGRVRPEQETFIANVNLAGGFAGIARSAAEALALVTKWVNA